MAGHLIHSLANRSEPFWTETALDPLRQRADFRLLTIDLDFPTGPFAKPD